MSTVSSTASTRGFRLLGVLFGLVAASFMGGVGYMVGTVLQQTTRLDWYTNPAIERIPSGDVALIAAAVGAGAAVLFGPLCFTAAFAQWRRRLRKAPAPAAAPGATPWDVAKFQLTLLMMLALAVLTGASLYSALAFSDVSVVRGDGLPILFAGAGAFAGVLAGYAPWALASNGLSRGRLVEPRADENLFSKLALFSARNAKPVIAVVLTLAVLGGYGASFVHTNVDVADVMPRGDPNTAAAKNLTERFKSTFTQQVTFQMHVVDPDDAEQMARYERDQELTPHRQTEPDPVNISDETYVRALDEMITFIKMYPGSPFTGSVAVPDFYRLINWTLAGGTDAPDASFSLPPPSPNGAMQYRTVDEGVWAAIPDTVEAVMSPTHRQTAVLMNVDPKEELDSKEIGEWALRIREAYVEAVDNGETKYTVFGGENHPMFSVDLPLANAHESELAAKDFKFLIPFISAYIVLCLAVTFRSWSAILIAFGSLATAMLWTFGTMGFLDIPLNTLNLTTVALIMGVGIDYGIHAMNEYQEHRARGSSMEDAFRRTGRRGFLALFIATLTTVSGLTVMIVSPSLLIAQLGFLSAVAMASCFILTVTFVPAALALAGDSAKVRDYKPSPLMGKAADLVGRNRVLTLVLVLALTGSAYAASANLTKEEFGDPPKNWLESDPMRQEHEKAIKGFYDSETEDVKTNVLVFEGDIKDPQAHRYMDAIEASLRDQERINGDTLRTLPFLVRTWLTVKDGAPGAGQFLLLDGIHQRGGPAPEQYPQTRAEIEQVLNEMHESPLVSFANLFYDYPENEMAVMTFGAFAGSYEEAEEVWHQVFAAIQENEHLKPADLQVSFFGNTAINYLFIAKQLPWLTYMAVVTNLLVMVFVAVSTHSWRAVVTVGALNFVTSMWWLGLLPAFGIGLAITLTLPLVFIFAIGSDYGLHLALAAERTKDPGQTFRTTGKAVLMSAVTTLGSFLIYTQISNLAVRKTMVATSLAIATIFVVTVLIVPMLYPPKKLREAAAEADAAAPGERDERAVATVAR